MKNLQGLGRFLFATGVLGIAIEHFIYQGIMIGRAPAWPGSLPGKLSGAYLTGIVFIIISMTIFTGIKARVACITGALLIFIFAFLRHIPVVAADMFLGGAWTSAGKALVFIGGFLAIAATYPKVQSTGIKKFANLEKEFIIAGRLCLGIFMVIAGVQHFMFTGFVATLIPQWFPGNAELWSYAAGVMLLAGGVGLFIPKAASPAALLSGIMIFSWVWIVHIPRVTVSVSDNIAVFEALAFSGMAFVIMKIPASG